MTLCYLVGILCGLLAYVIYGLNIDLCPHDRTSYPYSQTINGVTQAIERTEVSVFGQIFPFDIMQNYFTTHNLNLTDDFSGLEIGSIFDGDVHNRCAPFKVNEHDPTLPDCSIISKTGKFILFQKKGREGEEKKKSFFPFPNKFFIY